MNIPTLPTDNLYKFTAIFGLIIISFGLYIISIGNTNYLERKKQLASTDFEFFQDSVKYAFKRKIYDSLSQQWNEEALSGNYSLEYLKKRLKRTENLYSEVKILHEEVIKNQLLLVKRQFDLEAVEYTTNKNNKMAILLIVIGTILISWGFINWYKKHQLYIDAEIKCKGESFVKQLNARKKKEE